MAVSRQQSKKEHPKSGKAEGTMHQKAYLQKPHIVTSATCYWLSHKDIQIQGEEKEILPPDG